jgi:enamine deaminase RidA (YjgF/YER057c/UK114 family)
MRFSNVVRTWLYLDDLLSWYDDFNAVRTRFFKERRVFDGLVPASTGVSGSHRSGAALVAELFAVAPKDGSVHVSGVPSPLQCPAPRYGSSFSRAVEIATPEYRRLLISGTASIGPDGRSLYIDDLDAQIACTVEVVRAILESRSMGWRDVSRAIAYVKHAEDAGAFERHASAHGLPPLPLLTVQNGVCREELLFELELDAVANGSRL